MIIKVLTKFLRRMDERSENVNKDRKYSFSSRVIRTKWKKKQTCRLKCQEERGGGSSKCEHLWKTQEQPRG